MTTNARFGTIVGLTFFLAACATGIDPALQNSPDYQQGYSDGCRTAQDRANGFGARVTRNEAIYSTNKAYQVGWRGGYGACGGSSIDPREYNDDQWYQDVD